MNQPSHRAFLRDFARDFFTDVGGAPTSMGRLRTAAWVKLLAVLPLTFLPIAIAHQHQKHSAWQPEALSTIAALWYGQTAIFVLVNAAILLLHRMPRFHSASVVRSLTYVSLLVELGTNQLTAYSYGTLVSAAILYYVVMIAAYRVFFDYALGLFATLGGIALFLGFACLELLGAVPLFPISPFAIVHPAYTEASFTMAIMQGTASGILLVFFAINYGVNQSVKLQREMEDELQTAHQMQMGLMSADPPQIEGLELAGRCVPATHVGGDLFKILPLGDDRVLVCLADVTGHGMQAAIPVVMFNGILENQLQSMDRLEPLMSTLNQVLHRTLSPRTFVCCMLGDLSPREGRYRFSSCASPYPFHYIGARRIVEEWRLDAYPLGIRPDTDYDAIDVDLNRGDRVVFCSDGMIEATAPDGEMFGFTRIADTILAACVAGLCAAEVVDRLFADVETFTQSGTPEDDMTVVVMGLVE